MRPNFTFIYNVAPGNYKVDDEIWIRIFKCGSLCFPLIGQELGLQQMRS